jgi:hypothetical protein
MAMEEPNVKRHSTVVRLILFMVIVPAVNEHH